MKKLLPEWLTAFIGSIVLGMLFSASANAQIVYTDVNPDSTMYCDVVGSCTLNYNLDLNNDANNDFLLTAFRVDPPQIGNPTYSNVTASPLNGNAVKDTLVNTVNVSINLQFNAVIDSNLLLNQSWQTSGTHSLRNGVYGGGLDSDTVWGLWDNLSDYYLGLRILQSGQNHYGWVRLRVDVTISYASVIVRDYAYNSIPDQPILAGEGQPIITGTAENSFASSINIFPNPAIGKLTIALGSNNKKVEVTITDVNGKIIYATTAGETQLIEVNTQDFAAGIYVVQIQAAGSVETRKLMITK